MGQILVLGAGECGLPLAHRLLRGGRPVTLVTDRDAEAVLAGTVTSTQVKFSPTQDLEADLGLGYWRSIAPNIEGIRFTMAVDRTTVVTWAGRLSRPAQSVDQRTVFARWLGEYLAEGGDLRIAEPSVADIEHSAADYDLTVVTRAGRDLAGCFEADPAWPTPAAPLRRLAVLYLDGVEPDPEGLGSYTTLPEHGEVISYPGLTGRPGQERHCEMLLFEARPGGALDVFDQHGTPTQRWAQARRLLETHLPVELAERFRYAQPTDAGATLVGAVTPVMRRPVGALPSGRPVLGGGDVVCRMDPGGAQGANNAVHCALRYGEAILHDPDGPYDRAWMEWAAAPWLTAVAHPAARWTATVLDPPPAMQEMMLAAQHDPTLADAFADTFARPANLARLAAKAAS
ncbi:styrene monooxygenase/indole monooxygenase family protein [Nocardia sp. CY41]|uniref:styrene monooxygenase/indole monooxygenase family protein n=1 Tax=Nocardia sp. CY41 TaxID=2608686 RepID=UPI00135C1926|nr:styrene monooxygenase/indole monooxygenase family protein [Nocardia sp. CY41]